MADPSQLPPLPKNHLSHPENWTTGSDPATAKQKGFIKVLENQHADLVPKGGMDVDGLGKSEASEVIEKLKAGVEVDAPGKVSGGDAEEGEKVGKKELEDMQGEGGKEGLNGSTKRKAEDATESEDTGKEEKEGANGKGEDEDVASAGEDAEGDEAAAPKKKEAGAAKKNGENGSHSEKKRGSEKNGDGKDQADGEGKDKKVAEEEGKKEERAAKKPRTSPRSTPSKGNGDESDPIEVDAAEPTKSTDETDTSITPQNGNGNTTIPGDNAHLDHPENWTTGDEPATAKQKGFLKVLEGQKGVEVGSVEELGKSEASEKIDELKNM